MNAYDYPLMGVFWSMLIFFVWFAWIILLFRCFADIFRSDDLHGGGKALWTIFVLCVPFLGVFVYLIARGHGMAQRDADHAAKQQQAFNAYVKDAAGSSTSSADELAKLSDLKDRGVITEAEFQTQKAKILS